MNDSFITLEGIDGAGKSTHLQALAEHIRQTGKVVLITREPGGTVLAEQLRTTILSNSMDALTEALLVFAARRDHVQKVILPALKRGETVLCDRFSDSSLAYQGGGRGLALNILHQLEAWVHPELVPHLTLWFDLPPVLAAQRRQGQGVSDRFEQQDVAFFERVQQAYANQALKAPKRFVRIDASLEPHEVLAQIEDALSLAV